MTTPELPPTALTSLGVVWSPELGKRIAFTLAILLVARAGLFIPVPGIEVAALGSLFGNQLGGSAGWLGGSETFARTSIFALGLTPFVAAWVLLELLGGSLEPADKARYRRWLTAAMAAFQALALARAFEDVRGLVAAPGPLFWLTATLSMTAGTLLLMWLGEQITRRGLCDGIWLIIAADVVAGLPRASADVAELTRAQAFGWDLLLLLLAVLLAAVALIVLIETARRQVPLQQTEAGPGIPSHLDLKVDHATVLPAYIAGYVLFAPVLLAGVLATSPTSWLATTAAALGRGQPLYLLLYAAFLLISVFLATAAVVSPRAIAAGLQRKGVTIAGVPPAATAVYLDGTMTRLTAICAIYLLVICLLPDVLITHAAAPFYFGGAPLLIVVIVTLDVLARARAASTSVIPST